MAAVIVAAISLFVMVGAYSSAVALQATAALTILVHGVLLVRRYRGIGRNGELPSFLFIVALFFWFYLPLASGAAEDPDYEHRAVLVKTTTEHAVQALTAVNLFAACFYFAHQTPILDRLARGFVRATGGGELRPNARRLAFLAIVVAIALGFYVVAAGGVGSAIRWVLTSRSEQKPWDPRGYAASGLSFFDVFATAFLVGAGSVALLVALQPGRRALVRIGFFGLAVVAVLWTALESGTRSIVLQITVPALAVALQRFSKSARWSRAPRIAAIVVLAVGTILLADFQRQYRSTAEVEGVSLQVQDNDFFVQTAFAIAVHEIEGRDLHDSAFLHIVSGPFPRALWPSKPKMESVLVFSRYIWGYDVSDLGANTIPSIVGQYYLNWGWLGVVEIGLFLGLILRILDVAALRTPLGSSTRFACMAASAYVFVSFRMLSFSFFAPMVASIVFVAVTARWARLNNAVATGTNRPTH